jgi:hypothetical protein
MLVITPAMTPLKLELKLTFYPKLQIQHFK